jgi:acetyltransferase
VRALLFPRSVAVVGASPRRPETVSAVVRSGVPAWGVNPGRREVLGLPCVPSLADLPEPPEAAILLVNHDRVEGAFAEAVAAGVRAVVLPGLGNEAGAAAAPIAGRVAERAIATGVAVCGPNCMGIAVPGGLSLWIGTVPRTAAPGHVSAVCQSGSIGEALLALGGRVGFRCIVSSGGEVVTDSADYLSCLAEDGGTRAVALFLETVRRPEAFAGALAACAEAGKPVVCLKVGRSRAGARAALAHTGALVGSERAFSAVLARYGAIEVGDFHELVETMEVLGRRRWPRGTRSAAISESGGECALLADAGEAAGLAFDPLPEALASALLAEFPNYLEPHNPLDAWAVADEHVVYPRSLELLARAGAFDVLLAQVDLSQFRGDSEQEWCAMIVRALAAAADGTEVFPAVTTVHSADPPAPVQALARELDLALLRGLREACHAIRHVATWQPRGRLDRTEPGIDLADLLRPGPLPEHDSALALERYGVVFCPRRRAATPADAAASAAELGCPVVVKLDGPAHKARVGGVVLGVATPEAAGEAAERLGGPVLVARQVPAGPEVICGLTRDEHYGPILAVGRGGAAVEERAGGVVLCAAPVDHELARELVRRAGIHQAVDGVAAALVALSRVACDHPSVVACDLNPLILVGDDVIAVDALLVGGHA